MNEEKDKMNGIIGERLRRLRFDNDLTQAEVAQQLGVTQQTYSRYEGGEAKLDSLVIVKLCELYGVTSDYLLGIEGERRSVEPDKVSSISDGDVDIIVERLLKKLKSEDEE